MFRVNRVSSESCFVRIFFEWIVIRVYPDAGGIDFVRHGTLLCPESVPVNAWPIVCRLVCTITLSMLSGCEAEADRSLPTVTSVAADDSITDQPRSEPSAQPLPGPRDSLQSLRQARLERRYSDLGDYLMAEQSDEVLAFVRAADRLTVAANLLRRRAVERWGLAAAELLDYRDVSHILGVLSRDVTLTSERIETDRAFVNFQLADRLPLQTAEMRRVKGRWVLVCDPVTGVAEEIVKLAGLLEQVAGEISQGERSADDVRSDLNLRQTPIVRRLTRLLDAGKDGAPHDP